ncbi:MAG: hypothetical protein HY731_06330 [Candidatus Tectomicrobia bacterium]|nr:hypothetical protein [Candidatus Tectomicrobia bacterium]
MFFDPIVEELHQTRQRIWKEAGGTWEGLLKYLHEKRSEYIERLVTPEQTEQDGVQHEEHQLTKTGQ